MNNSIEIRRNNVTVAEFLRYAKAQCAKKGLSLDFTKEEFENPYARYNDHYFVRDGIKYVSIPNGPYQEWDGTDAPCKSEIFRQLPLDFQVYILNWDGSCYNEICEFTYDDNKRGCGYYYQAIVEAEPEQESITGTVAERNAEEYNEKVFAEIMSETGATREEVIAMCEIGCSLESARKYIAEEKETARLYDELFPESLQYYREIYDGESVSEKFIQRLAHELTEELAEAFRE